MSSVNTHSVHSDFLSTDQLDVSIGHHDIWCLVVGSRRGQFTIVPILVGSLTLDREQSYGQLLARYLADPDNLFVISSDFCHWG